MKKEELGLDSNLYKLYFSYLIMGNNEQRKKAVSGVNISERTCEGCGWDKYPIILTLHHVFPKHLFKPQPKFNRKYRYLILCPTCHSIIHNEIITEYMGKLIAHKIDTCEQFYCNYTNIKEIISKCRDYYGIK